MKEKMTSRALCVAKSLDTVLQESPGSNAENAKDGVMILLSWRMFWWLCTDY